MPRFRDEWVIDRVLMDFFSGGSCSCCGLQHFLPNGTADLIGAISDLETDQQKAEVAALQFHPWPSEVRDQVWADRVRLRQKLKMDKKEYQAIWQDDDQEQKQAFIEWCWKPETYQNYRRWFQLSRAEIMENLQQKYNIHSAFGVVLCAVLEQVAAFKLTEYPPDGRGEVEMAFERILTFDKRGGFTLSLVKEDGVTLIDNEGDKNLSAWIEQMENIGSPGKKLLQRGPSSGAAAKEEDEGDPDGPDGVNDSANAKSSFASDRRIIRLIIARMFAKLLQEKFKEQEENPR